MMDEKPFKRVVILSDLHCGHRVGLTPERWQSAIPGDRYYRIQIETWARFKREIDALRPIDICIVNGDAIDGKGTRSGGQELLTPDRMKQVDIATECIGYVESKTNIFVKGTPYHVGENEDWENDLARNFNMKAEDHAFLKINGVNFDIKHFVGASSIPHGRFTAISRARLWNIIWNAEGEQQPDADVLIRSHVHYCVFSGEANEWLACTTPALQGAATKYGARLCEGIVHWGFLMFDVYSTGAYSWKRIIPTIAQTVVVPTEL